MSKLIRTGSEVDLFYLEGISPFLVVTFSHMTMRGQGFWGEQPCRKSNFSALGFVAKRRNWFPKHEVDICIDSSRKILEKYTEIITYGFSFGGYASLRYSSALGASCAVAFSPQYSIAPEDVSFFDTRFLSYFEPNIHQDMKIHKEDDCKNAYLFVDPHHSSDLKNAELIKREADQVSVLNIPFFGHSTILSVASSSSFSSIIKESMRSSSASLGRLIARLRRMAKVRPAMVALRLARSRPIIAERILLSHPDSFDTRRKVTLFRQLASSWLKKGRADLAYLLAKQAVDMAPADERARALLLRAHMKFAEHQHVSS